MDEPARAEAARAEARIDLDAIRANVASLNSHAGSAGVMAVVKAEGYGHGMVPAARAALAGGASWLGVTVVEEALALRAAGITAPVLAWLHAPGEDFTAAVAAEVDLSVNGSWAVHEIAGAAERAGRTARVHLKVDTGLGRAGCMPAEWPELLDTARAAEATGAIRVTGVWSHFAYADAPGHPTVSGQVTNFRDALDAAHRSGLRPEVRHLANSAATLTLPEARFDLVRPGISVYGLSPIPDLGGPEAYGLRPAMTLAARFIVVKRVPAGHGVSYGHEYVTDQETTLGVIPVGYADGITRSATNAGPVLAAGARRRIAGRVCMDQVVVDLGDDPAAVGDEVLIFGPGDQGEPTAQEWAELLGTISYEVVSRIGSRIPRVYRPIPGAGAGPDRASGGSGVDRSTRSAADG